MTLPKIKNFTDYNHYPSDPQPTTDADMQDYMQNQNDILTALTKRLWQPQTEYKLGDIVASDTMADGLVAVCTIAGVTSDIEPTWGVNEATVIDNSCTWIMRPAYCYGLATDGDVQTVYDGGEAEDSRLLSLGVLDKIFALIKDKFIDLFGENDVLPITHGGTGATTAKQARKNLGANDFVTGLSVSGKTITYNKKDGTSGIITTQDTVPSRYITSKYSSGTSWYEVYNDGWVRQGGVVTSTSKLKAITLSKAFANNDYTIMGTYRGESSDGSSTGFSGVTGLVAQPYSTTQFKTAIYASNGVSRIQWIAEGYGA